MTPEPLADRISSVGALNEPHRRRLYAYVSEQQKPVSRDQAAAALDLPRHTVKFHLDRLVDAGLLDVEHRRLSGRNGPGAGRPTKLYRRTTAELTVSLPERHYALAARLMARAIDQSTQSGDPVSRTLQSAAADEGRSLGATLRRDTTDTDPLNEVCAGLTDLGYEPRRAGDVVTMANCPFHTLTDHHAALVCGMNLALLSGLTSALDPDDALEARLDPTPDGCCVRLARSDQQASPNQA